MAHLVFIHGIANKPEAQELLGIWRRSLGREGGVNLGATGINSSMAYWADVMYGAPQEGLAAQEAADADAPAGLEAGEGLEALEDDWTRAFEATYGMVPGEGPDEVMAEVAGSALERIPPPWAIKRPFMKLLARDTHHYLFNASHSPRPGVTHRVRDVVRGRFVSALQAAAEDGGPLIVVAHSQGTVVAYDCLKNVPECPRVDQLITVGSPLGLHEVQEKLAPGYSREDGFPAAVTGAWDNVYDPLDIVSRPDPQLANDYCRGGAEVVTDHVATNQGLWRHSMVEYLSGPTLRGIVRRAFGLPDG